ncbi:MAG: ABC transporter ATP-binding protein [Nitrososphaeria archaeon]|nr:ABC transporter ATP-binding protein [Nitrososphaeria archaeon]
MEYAIEVFNLTKVYRSEGKEIRAVDNLNLKVEKGSIFGLLGPNGAGKTTLIMMLTGLTLPTGGSGKVLGHDIVKESLQIRRKVGLLPEGFGFYDHLTAEENLNYVAALNDIPKDERKKRIEDALASVGLLDVRDRKFGGYSRGMRQKLGIAQALLKNPELLIFDEPTAGIDPEGARAIRELVLKLNREGKTIMLSTHLLFEVGPVCDSIAIMNFGRLMLQGKVRELLEKLMAEEGYKIKIEFSGEVGAFAEALSSISGVKSVRLEGKTAHVVAEKDVRAEIGKLSTKYSIQILTLELQQPSLEDLFIKYYRREGLSYA